MGYLQAIAKQECFAIPERIVIILYNRKKCKWERFSYKERRFETLLFT